MSGTCGPLAGGAGAGSCDDRLLPAASNPPGLTQIAYRANDFAGFRQALLTPLPGEEQLTGWSPGPGDLGLEVLEWWAYLADILTFYNERIANNDYLRTAAAQPGKRRNVAALARLLGYLPRPATTATGVVAAIRSTGPGGAQFLIPPGTQIASTPAAGAPAQLFETELSSTGAIPTFGGPSDGLIALTPDDALFQPYVAEFLPKTGEARTNVTITGHGLAQTTKVTFGKVSVHFTVDSDTRLTALVPVQAGTDYITVHTPFGDAESQKKFEVPSGMTGVVAVAADPVEQAVATPAVTSKSVLLAGQVAVAFGEHLLLVRKGWDGTTGQWAVVTAGAATTEPDPNGSANTRLILRTATWNELDGPEVPKVTHYLLLRFTATAPLWTVQTPTPKKKCCSGSGSSGAQTFCVPLATVVRSVTPGDNVLFTGSVKHSAQPIQVPAHVIGYREVVTTTRPTPTLPLSSHNPNVFLPRTELTVRTEASDSSALNHAVQDSDLDSVRMLYGVREVGTLIASPYKSLDRLPTTATAPPGLVSHEHGQVALQDAKGAGLIVRANLGASGLLQLAAADGRSGPLAAPLTTPLRLFADLVNVSRGATVRDEILGSGDPATPSQAFALQHSPLIYLPSQNTGGPQSTLTVMVDGVAWKEVQAFSGEGPSATVYVARHLPAGGIQVLFGDGINGARLPLGVSNVTATYRYGAAVSPPPPGHLSTVLQPQPGLASVVNPVGLNPGNEREPARQTADAAPATMLLLGAASAPATSIPLISPGDWAEFAATVGGVTRARAYWTWDPSRQCPAVTLYVGGTGTKNESVAADVLAAIPAGALRVPLTVSPAHVIALEISCKLLAPQDTAQDVIHAATHALIDARSGLFSPGRTAIGQRLYRSQVEAALASAGAVAILSLKIGLSDPSGPGQASDDEFVPGSRPDGYFSLRAADLSVGVVSP